MTPTLDEVIDAVTDGWMEATHDLPEDAAADCVADYRQGCRNEVEVFLAVLELQPEPVRAEIVRMLLQAGESD